LGNIDPADLHGDLRKFWRKCAVGTQTALATFVTARFDFPFITGNQTRDALAIQTTSRFHFRTARFPNTKNEFASTTVSTFFASTRGDAFLAAFYTWFGNADILKFGFIAVECDFFFHALQLADFDAFNLFATNGTGLRSLLSKSVSGKYEWGKCTARGQRNDSESKLATVHAIFLLETSMPDQNLSACKTASTFQFEGLR
jgi:hypothetical protein